MLIDTHAHLYVKEYDDDLADVIFASKLNNIEKVLLPNIDVSTIPSLKSIHKKDPLFFFPMMGLHPTSVKADYKEQLHAIHNELNSSKDYIVIGEIGIDLYWDTTFVKEQTEAFETQLLWSVEEDLPVSIHSRSSYKEIVESLHRINNKNLKGSFHSFSGDSDDLKELLAFENFYIGINGVVTFKNSNLSTVLKNCPPERIVLETDSPYLTPMPYRGKRNEPKYLKQINQILSTIYGIKEEHMAQITKSNAIQLFGLNS